MKKNHPEAGECLKKRLKVYIAVALVATSGVFCLFPWLLEGLTPALSEYRPHVSWSLTAVIVALSIISLKKRGVIMAFGKLSGWYNLHFFLGLASVTLLPLHTSFFAGGGISQAMTWLTFFIASNGIYGFSVHAFMPHSVLKLELRNDNFNNLKGRERDLEHTLRALLSGKSSAYTELYQQMIRRRKNSLLGFFASIFSKECIVPDTLPSLPMRPPGIPDMEQHDYIQLKTSTDELFALKDQIRIIAFLNRWLVYHISAVTVLMLLLLIHISSFYYY